MCHDFRYRATATTTIACKIGLSINQMALGAQMRSLNRLNAYINVYTRGLAIQTSHHVMIKILLNNSITFIYIGVGLTAKPVGSIRLRAEQNETKAP